LELCRQPAYALLRQTLWTHSPTPTHPYTYTPTPTLTQSDVVVHMSMRSLSIKDIPNWGTSLMRTVAAVPTIYRAVYKSMPLNLGHFSMKNSQCWAAWGMVTLPYILTRNRWSPPQSSQTKDGRATDSSFTLFGLISVAYWWMVLLTIYAIRIWLRWMQIICSYMEHAIATRMASECAVWLKFSTALQYFIYITIVTVCHMQLVYILLHIV